MTTRKTKRLANRVVRKIARCGNPTQPVVLMDEAGGKGTVGITGESWRYETKGGRRIWHPTAYSKKGFSNMVYFPSTQRLECGREFYEFLCRFLGNC